MKYPVITPRAYRINTTISAPIDASLGGAIGPNDLQDTSLSININGDLGCIWAYGPNIAMLRIKANGQFCWYANCNFSAFRQVLTNSNIDIVNFLGTNAVQVWSHIGAPHYSTVVPFPVNFVNGGWINFSPIPFKVPACPCGGLGAAQSTYYDAKNNILLTEYIKGYPEDYQLWVATYKPGQNGNVILNQGYMGFFANASNPVLNSTGFNKVAGGISYSPNTDDTFSYDQNGNFIGRHIEFTDMIGAFVAVGASSINVGGLNCSGNSTNYPQVNLNLSYVLNMNDPVFTGYSFQNNVGSLAASATDIQGSACVFNEIHALNLFNSQTFVELYNVNGVGGSALYGAAFLQNQIPFVASRYNGATPPYNVSIFFATPKSQLPDLTPQPVIQSQQASQLLNWHRPISTRGLFKT